MKCILLLPLLSALTCGPGLIAEEPPPGMAAAGAVNHLAAALGKQLMTKSGNAVFSPWSAQSALAMMWTGAAGQTRSEMAAALAFAGGPEILIPSFKSLRTTLTTPGPKEPACTIRTVSRVFLDNEYDAAPLWKATVRDNFGADTESLSFATDGAAAAGRINQWVKASTGGRIPALYPPTASFALTRLVVADAVYFDVPWAVPFNKTLTRSGNFFVAKGITRQTSLMVTQQDLPYEWRNGFHIVAIPYAARDLQFVTLIPDKGGALPDVIAQLSPQFIAGCAQLKPRLVCLTIPRLRLDQPGEDLGEPLKRIGLTRALSPLNAEFPDISPTRPPLFISGVRQRTWLIMDEDGTQAAAATGVDGAPFGEPPPPPKPVIIRADRPFLFMIQHVPTAACLFIGRLSDPAAGGVALSPVR